MKKKSAAHTMRKATEPTTMPAMAPPESLCELLLLAAGVLVAVAVTVGAFTRVDDASAGMGSPGATWKSAVSAALICASRVCVSLGLITPTMC